MRRMIGLIIFVACVAATASSSGAAERKAALRLVDRDPLTIKGEGFRPRERVRVHVSVSESQRAATAEDSPRRVVRASASGSFRVVFAGEVIDRCDFVRVVAIRGRGGEVVLKLLPGPTCAPGLAAARP